MELLIDNGFEGISETVGFLMNTALQIERSKHLKAAPYEMKDDRLGNVNNALSRQSTKDIGVTFWAA
jgi:hypothetical protein